MFGVYQLICVTNKLLQNRRPKTKASETELRDMSVVQTGLEGLYFRPFVVAFMPQMLLTKAQSRLLMIHVNSFSPSMAIHLLTIFYGFMINLF